MRFVGGVPGGLQESGAHVEPASLVAYTVVVP